MLSLGIIVSHRSTSRGMLPESTRSSLDTAIARLNHAYKGKARVDIALDYEGFRDLSKNEQTQESIKKSMIELRNSFDELLFLLVVDGELGEGMKNELAHAKEANKQLSANRRIMIEALIRQREDYSEVSYPELMDKSNETLPVCTWYTDDKDFKNEAYRIINEILASRLDISGEGDDEKGKPSGVIWKVLLPILIAFLCIGVFWKRCSADKSEPGTPMTGIAIPPNENATVVVTDSTVSGSVNSGSKGEKRENNVKSDTVKRGSGKAGANDGQNGNTAKAVIDSNAFFIIANDPLPTSFRASISNGIISQISSLYKSDAKDNARWVITVTEDPSITEQPKTRETQEDIVTLQFTVEIIDATGLTHTYSTSFEHNDSHWGREAAINAARQSAVPRIVKLITEHIK